MNSLEPMIEGIIILALFFVAIGAHALSIYYRRKEEYKDD